MAFVISDGAILERSTDGATWATVVNVRSIVPPQVDPEFASTRNLTSAGANTMQWSGYGATDGSAEMDLDPDDTTHAAMLVDAFDGTSPASRYFRVTHSNTGGGVAAWRGVTKLAPNSETGQWIKASVSWKVLDPATISWTA